MLIKKKTNTLLYRVSVCVCMVLLCPTNLKVCFYKDFSFIEGMRQKVGGAIPLPCLISVCMYLSHTNVLRLSSPKRKVLPSFPQGMDHNNMQYCYMQQCTDMAAGQVIRTLSMNYEDPRYSIMASEV